MMLNNTTIQCTEYIVFLTFLMKARIGAFHVYLFLLDIYISIRGCYCVHVLSNARYLRYRFLLAYIYEFELRVCSLVSVLFNYFKNCIPSIQIISEIIKEFNLIGGASHIKLWYTLTTMLNYGKKITYPPPPTHTQEKTGRKS